MRTLAASFAKELRLWIRDPKVFAGSMLAPLVVLVVFYLLFGRIPSLPVALVNLDKGPHSATLVELFQTVESPFGDPYLDVRLVGASEAQDIFRAEEVVAVLTIPDTFTNDVEGARRGKAGPDVDLLINNINSDMAKNIRLYLTQVIGQFYEQVYDNVEFTITEDSTHDLRVPWFTEIGLGVVIFSISLAGMFNASSSLLREFQENTIKELLLAPRHMSALLGGKALLALAGALASGGLMYAVVVLLCDAGFDLHGGRLHLWASLQTLHPGCFLFGTHGLRIVVSGWCAGSSRPRRLARRESCGLAPDVSCDHDSARRNSLAGPGGNRPPPGMAQRPAARRNRYRSRRPRLRAAD